MGIEMDGDHFDSLAIREKANRLQITIHKVKNPRVQQPKHSFLPSKLSLHPKIAGLPSRLNIQGKQAESYSYSLSDSVIWIDW
jgi:hypothetical protein